MNQPCRGQSCVTCGLPKPELTATGHVERPAPPESRMYGLGRTLLVGGMFALVLLGVAMRNRTVTTAAPSIANHLPKDAMVAGVYEVDPVALLDEWVERFDRFGDDGRTPMTDGLRELDEQLGMSFRDDVLAAFGPSFGFALDLEPLDPAALAGWSDTIPRGLVLAVTVRDETSAIVALTALLELADGELRREDDRLTIELPGEELTFHGTLRGRTLLLAGTAELARRATRGFTAGEQLFDGADFAACLAQVDPDAEMLTYVNLPRIRDWLRDGGLQHAPGAGELAALFDDDWSGVGMMQTATRTAGGMRSTRFGPAAFGSGVLSSWTGIWSMTSAVGIVERWLATTDRPGSREATAKTVAAIRRIGAAVEAYRTDRGSYPATGGWVPADLWRDELQPAYVSMLPTRDGWGRTMIVMSDGTSYRIVSPGPDGVVERDWSGDAADPMRDGEPVSDLVFVDGSFVVGPGD